MRRRERIGPKATLREVDEVALQRTFVQQGVQIIGCVGCACGCGRKIWYGRKDGVFCIAPNMGPAVNGKAIIDVLRVHTERDLLEALGELVKQGSVSPKFLPEAYRGLANALNPGAPIKELG